MLWAFLLLVFKNFQCSVFANRCNFKTLNQNSFFGAKFVLLGVCLINKIVFGLF